MLRACIWAMVCLVALAAAPSSPAVHSLDDYAIVGADGASPEGVWRAGANGAIFEIKPLAGKGGCYELRIIDSCSDPAATAGMVFGTMALTDGAPRRYDATLYHALSGAGAKRTRHFIIDLAADGASLTFRHYNKGWVLNPLRLVPYLSRISVHRTDSRPADADGAVRIAPTKTPATITL